jgi:hypothetical protein
MSNRNLPATVRRSVALSRHLVEEVTAVAPPALGQNFNRLVTIALQEFTAHRKAHAFQEMMAQMASDPAIQAECTAISMEFAPAESDGLRRVEGKLQSRKAGKSRRKRG